MTTSPQVQHQRHPTFRQYAMVATMLFVLTIIEFMIIWNQAKVWMPWIHTVDPVKVPLLIFLSGIKFATVIMFYMHLKFDSRLFTVVFIAGLALAFVVGFALLGLFRALHAEAQPREFAEAKAQPYVEPGGHGGVKETGAAPGAIAPSEATAPGGALAGVILDIGALGDQLKFDKDKFNVKAGEAVVLRFKNNATALQHNWVLVAAGAKDAVATAGTAAGPANDWIPRGNPQILAYTRLLNKGETGEVRFTAPEAGAYQFVCTFPGHNFTMFGELAVTK